MFLAKYNINVNPDDFAEAEQTFHLPVSYGEGDLIYNHEFEPDKTFIVLHRENIWEYEGKYSFTVWQDGRISGIRACGDSFEDAFAALIDYANQDENPTMWRCAECGSITREDEMGGETVPESWGDVVAWVCPVCGTADYEGRNLFEEYNG